MDDYDITEENILRFFKDYQNHDLPKHLKSDPIPAIMTGFV